MKAASKIIGRLATGVVLACCLALFTSNASAIEGLQLSVQSSNVILSWPSTNIETYIVQHRGTLQALAQWSLTENQRLAIAGLTNMPPRLREQYTMIAYINNESIPYRAAVINSMLKEANYFADKLQLPTKRPVEITDIQDSFISRPWFGILRDEKVTPNAIVSIYGTNIFNAHIPREARLRALNFAALGRIDTTNFEFGFDQGKLLHVMRLDGPDNEYYSRRLDELIGKPSLIDTNSAYQLATQWLAAVDMDMPEIKKLKWTINQLHYKATGTTNYVTLPLYYVDFGNKHYPAKGNLQAFDEPLISVEILGTTKTLQELLLNDGSFSRRPIMIITNALDLIRAPDLQIKQLQPAITQTNSTAP